jgi:hypothetical protein
VVESVNNPAALYLIRAILGGMDHPNAPHLGSSTRWQAGQTGNRGGRPKAVETRRRSIEAAQLVALEGLIDRALSGDASALALLMADRGAYVAPGTAYIVPSAMVPHDP